MEDVLRQFFGGGFGRAPGQGPRFRRQTDDAGFRQHHQRQNNGNSDFQQMYLFIIMAVVMLTSMFTPEQATIPKFSFERTHQFTHKLIVPNVDVEYFVKPNFEKELRQVSHWGGGLSQKRRNMETLVEHEFVHTFSRRCTNEEQIRNRKLRQLKRESNEKALLKEQNRAAPEACEKLKEYRNKARFFRQP